MPIPVEFVCTAANPVISDEMRVRIVNANIQNASVQKETSFIRTLDMGGAEPVGGVSEMHSALEKSVSITQYIYNASVYMGVAIRDFYNVNNTTITKHTCSSENPQILPISCPQLSSSLIGGNWYNQLYKYVMVRESQPFSVFFKADPTQSKTIELSVTTRMSSKVTVSGYGTFTLNDFVVTDEYSCRFSNPLTFNYPDVIEMGVVKHGETAAADFILEYGGYVGALPNTELTITHNMGGKPLMLGGYNISLQLPDGTPYVFGEPIKPLVKTMLKVYASPEAATPATGPQSAEINITHSFN
ncbi:hypothetical protein C3432_11735 [Citrobacter amalonaticus]|uniref:Uncharacterized protein n=2 Tax=Citrobacter amalonaticus TaxID=35703 RepID=A0A2S4RPZ2_CITAM|nr:hypothetical protein C3432_11735 [Citrobacter amalonaticus]POT75928.1 hypothetical protein C3436_00080 [Citrobacter amalonaticus]POU59110.1 hypothetical protein C3430_26920 [Citrobacter amalonaticus]POV05163.1 hypothetical protein C3424_07385 [Citrobacter amalonaticus]